MTIISFDTTEWSIIPRYQSGRNARWESAKQAAGKGRDPQRVLNNISLYTKRQANETSLGAGLDKILNGNSSEIANTYDGPPRPSKDEIEQVLMQGLPAKVA